MRGALVTVLVAATLVGAVIGGVYALNRPADELPAATAPTPTPSSLPTVELTPTATPTPTAPAATATKRALPRVAPSVARRIQIPTLVDVGFDNAVAPRDGVFSAGSTAEVARWGGRGLPGSPATDTVYVIGKVSVGGAFEKLPNVVLGDRITLRTDTGVLSYTVQAVQEKPAAGLTKDRAFTQRVSGRLQLVGIRYTASGERTGTILVVTALLTGARATR